MRPISFRDRASLRSKGPDGRVRGALSQILIGTAVAAFAVAFRYSIPLPFDLLPTLAVVIGVSIVTVFVGTLAGIAAAVIGGLASWYIFFSPLTWTLDYRSTVSLVGYAAMTSVILVTSSLYRMSEVRRRNAEIAQAMDEVERAELFAGEMAHRLKNALSIAQALASQTFERQSPDYVKFAARLKALADANNLLNEHIKEPTASLDEVVHIALEPFGNWSDRIEISGPPLEIRDQQVVSLALALHELGTNAIKYGALSNDDGVVEINWRGSAREYELVWKEKGGPAVKTSERRGFGSKLLNRDTMRSELRFEEDGVRCVIRSD